MHSGQVGATVAVDSRLDRLAAIASELDDRDLAGEATAERQRLLEARFFAACVGQFKRGKSTLINALVGEDVLPVGVIPVTSWSRFCRMVRPRAPPCNRRTVKCAQFH